MITKNMLKALRVDVEEALKAVGQKHGIDLSTGNCTFGIDNAKMQLLISTIGEGGVVKTAMATSYEKHQKMYQLPPLGSERSVNCEPMKIVGFKPRSTKYPVIVENHRGQQYKISIKQAGGKDFDHEDWTPNVSGSLELVDPPTR